MIELILKASPGDKITKTTYCVREEDYELIRDVFPERGFLTYFPGGMFRLLADELRAKGVTKPEDRIYIPALAGIPSVMKSFKFELDAQAGQEAHNE